MKTDHLNKQANGSPSLLSLAGIAGLALLVNGGLLFLIAWANQGLEPTANPPEETWTIRNVQMAPPRETEEQPEKVPENPPEEIQEPPPQETDLSTTQQEFTPRKPEVSVPELDLAPFAAGSNSLFPDVTEQHAVGQPGPTTTSASSTRLDELPRRTAGPAPSYPPAAQRNNVEGWVLLSFSVDEEGNVFDVEVLDYAGSRQFTVEARKAVSQWSFEPGKIDGRPLTVTDLRQRVLFELE